MVNKEFVYLIMVRKWVPEKNDFRIERDTFYRSSLIDADEVHQMSETLRSDVVVSLIGVIHYANNKKSDANTFESLYFKNHPDWKSEYEAKTDEKEIKEDNDKNE